MRRDMEIHELLTMTTVTAKNARELREYAFDLQDELYNNEGQYEACEIDGYWMDLEAFKEKCSDIGNL
jgi:hypothetical protein